jgi:hypothetical protein
MDTGSPHEGELVMSLDVWSKTIIFVSIVVFGCDCFWVGLSAPSWKDADTALLVAAVSVVLFAGFLFLRIVGVRRGLKSENQPAYDLPVSEAIRYADDLFDDISKEAAIAFNDAIVRSSYYIQRISESVDINEGHVDFDTSYVLALQGDPRYEATYFPLALLERSELADELRIYRGEKRVSSLVRPTATAFMIAAFRRLVHAAGGNEAVGEYRNNAESGVVAVLTARSPQDALQFQKTIAALSELSQNVADDRFILEMMLALVFLRSYYPLLVDVARPPSSYADSAESAVTRTDLAYTRFRVTQRRVLRRRLLEPNAFVWLGRRNWRLFVSLLLGVHPNDVIVPIDDAERARSYHVHINGVDGTYLGDHVIDSGELSLPPQRSPRRGQNYAHAYVTDGRFFRGAKYRAWFFEVPPGSIGIATGAGFATLLGMALISLSQLKWITSTPMNSLTILLGLPGVVVGFLGLGRSAGFFRGSLLSRFSVVISLTASLCAIVFAALISRRTTLEGSSLIVSDLNLLPRDLIFWAVIVGVQTINTLVALFTWIYRVVAYWLALTN